MTETNMYPLSKKQWNFHPGCDHHCSYCESSFQRQLKRWAKKGCRRCYDFVPHFHESRLFQSLPKTEGREFIFALSNGDSAFVPTSILEAMNDRVRHEPDKTFLTQSKNPGTFNRVEFPSNMILGTTIETNREELYKGISSAPLPYERLMGFLSVGHSRKMFTAEPIIDFDVDIMVKWVCAVEPEMVWVGYDSKRNYLPEPELRRTEAFCQELESVGFFVVRKTMRKAWWEK